MVHPSGEFGVTELIEAACKLADARWVVRLDDDEFPTKCTVDYFSETSKSRTAITHAFSRRWVMLHEGRPTFYYIDRYKTGDEHYDLQKRMFLNSNLEFDHQIHTVGIIHKNEIVLAPPDCFIVHFDALIKSRHEQMLKIRRYENLENSSAWFYSDLYLPSIYSTNSFRLCSQGIAEFQALLNAVNIPPKSALRLRVLRELKRANTSHQELKEAF